MSEPRLVLRLRQVGCYLFGWVEHQDEKLRSGISSLAAVADVRLSSADSPQLSETLCYVRGSNTRGDCRPLSYHYDSPEEASRVLEAIRQCVRQVNAQPAEPDVDEAGFERIA